MLTLKPQGSKHLLRADFQDLYNNDCSIQEASERRQFALWLGVSHDFEGKPSTRMILSQDQVKALLPHLTLFAETGFLGQGKQRFATPKEESGAEKSLASTIKPTKKAKAKKATASAKKKARKTST